LTASARVERATERSAAAMLTVHTEGRTHSEL
jgi:hypothetical protein